MAVIDDVRRLMQLDFMFLGVSYLSSSSSQTVWHKGRIQQANDGTFIFRSISSDGTVVGAQLGNVGAQWSSTETIGGGISVQILIASASPLAGLGLQLLLTQSIPQELA